MTAYFNVTLFKQNLLRFWPLAAVAFLAALIAFVVPEAASSRVDYFHIYDVSGSLITSPQIKDIMSGLAIFCSLVVFPLSIFTAIAVFDPESDLQTLRTSSTIEYRKGVQRCQSRRSSIQHTNWRYAKQ